MCEIQIHCNHSKNHMQMNTQNRYKTRHTRERDGESAVVVVVVEAMKR